MVNRIELAPGREIFGNPVPLGLLGLAIGCAALVPSTFGYGLTPAGLKTAAMFAYLFGAGCQMLCGLMCLANRNVLSGTVFTAFAFLWIFNGWALDSVAKGLVPDHAVGLATEIVLFAIFVALTYAFGFYSKLLFLFLVDIDLLFVLRIAKSVTSTRALDAPIGIVTIALAALALWLAFGALINPVAGRQIFRMAGPLMSSRGGQGFDWTLRRAIFDALYAEWQKNAFAELQVEALTERLSAVPGHQQLGPELRYLGEFGYLNVTLGEDGQQVRSVRLNARGIDLYEQLVLHKYG
ncbi:MAG: GPR1/FUN34/YaaH family transporter [Polyangia bacterium]|jgi:succinate-acetate transporter protein|nr:GPR1/FUN34/YaaH family transporter [Polyangia bacterium]